MKSVVFAGVALLSMVSMGFFLVNLSGCQTETPGATDTLGVYSTNVDSPCDKTTVAAKEAADDLNLTNVVAGGGTKENGKLVGGKVTAKNAQGSDVTINIAVTGENVSKVTIYVGATGDQVLSKQLVDRIKAHLSWL